MTHTLTTYNEAVHTALHILATDMGYEIPPSDTSQERAYLRALMNIRGPAPLPDGYPEAEAIVLDAERERTGTATWENATASPVHPRMALWRGDITRLEVDAIVNAANSALLGCRAPGHTCIDNAIHSAAGLELRQACASRFVIHTVGPIVSGELTDEHREALTRSYRRCLEEATAHGLNTVAFCCISTGVFGFPQEEAARIAVSTVTDFLDSGTPGASELRVIVDVFGDHDEALYRALLGL